MPKRLQSKQRLLTTVLFTDIVGSTQRATELGDRRWRQLLTRHHAVIRRLLKRYGGREIDTAGDGFFATFDQPAQAIECAVAIGRAVRPLGIEVRAGVHMGEVEVTVDKVAGIAVHIGSRVMSTAGPGEVLVSNTVRDLLSGSEFRFEDRGVKELKGIPGEWKLAAVTEVPGLEEEEEVPEEAAAPRHRRALPVPLIALIVLGIVAVLVIPPIVSGRGGETGSLPPPAVNTVVRIDPSAHKVLGGIAVGRTPVAIASAGSTIWVANFDDGTVQSIDTSSNAASPATALGFSVAPNGLAVGGGFVWVVSSTTGTLYRIDPTQAHGITTINLEVGLAAVAFGDGALWITSANDDTVLRLDPSNLEATPGRVQLGAGANPRGIAVEGGAVWVAEALKGKVARIDPGTMKVSATVPLLKGNPDEVAYGEGFVWVTDTEDDSVTRIDPSSNGATTIKVGDGAAGIATGNGAAWVANGLDGTVAEIDPKAAKVVNRVALGAGLSPDGVAVTAGGVWVTVHSP